MSSQETPINLFPRDAHRLASRTSKHRAPFSANLLRPTGGDTSGCSCYNLRSVLEGCIDSHRGVAQPGRALRSGRRGRWFKSSRPDSKSKQLVSLNCGELFLVEEQRFALFSRLVFSVQSIPRISTRWISDFRNVLCASRLESSNPVATFKRLGR